MGINVQQVVGDVSPELGEKFRAGDGDVVIMRNTAEIRGQTEIAEGD